MRYHGGKIMRASGKIRPSGRQIFAKKNYIRNLIDLIYSQKNKNQKIEYGAK